MTLLRLSLRQYRRGWKSGEYTVMAVALALALAAVSAVGFFTSRVQTAVTEQAGESLAADILLQSGEALPPELARSAAAAGAATARVMDFPTVLLAGDATQLVDVHAVTAGYPLRGRVQLSDELQIQICPHARLLSSIGSSAACRWRRTRCRRERTVPTGTPVASAIPL